jgi:hypothetical protein
MSMTRPILTGLRGTKRALLAIPLSFTFAGCSKSEEKGPTSSFLESLIITPNHPCEENFSCYITLCLESQRVDDIFKNRVAANNIPLAIAPRYTLSHLNNVCMCGIIPGARDTPPCTTSTTLLTELATVSPSMPSSTLRASQAVRCRACLHHPLASKHPGESCSV